MRKDQGAKRGKRTGSSSSLHFDRKTLPPFPFKSKESQTVGAPGHSQTTSVPGLPAQSSSNQRDAIIHLGWPCLSGVRRRPASSSSPARPSSKTNDGTVALKRDLEESDHAATPLPACADALGPHWESLLPQHTRGSGLCSPTKPPVSARLGLHCTAWVQEKRTHRSCPFSGEISSPQTLGRIKTFWEAS